jgi:hypothetical protein
LALSRPKALAGKWHPAGRRSFELFAEFGKFLFHGGEFIAQCRDLTFEC